MPESLASLPTRNPSSEGCAFGRKEAHRGLPKAHGSTFELVSSTFELPSSTFELASSTFELTSSTFELASSTFGPILRSRLKLVVRGQAMLDWAARGGGAGRRCWTGQLASSTLELTNSTFELASWPVQLLN